MRRFIPTLLLIAAAALVGWLASWQWREGSFDALLGAPPVEVGKALYPSFPPAKVKHITVNGSGASAKFSLQQNGWHSTSPWRDRMDPRAAVAIINFTRSMCVEDHVALEKISEEKSGLNHEAVTILLEDANRKPLAHYKIGRVTPWKASAMDTPEPIPTVYINPREKGRKKHVYACTGDINAIFKDGFRFLRDHRPFYFNPLKLSTITIFSKEGQLLVARESPDKPWRIVKPLDLATNPASIRALLKGLFELQALKVNDKAAGDAANTAENKDVMRIGIRTFDSEALTELEIRPTESVGIEDAIAFVSDRPGVEFLMPAKPVSGMTSLADLPLTINELRDPALTHLNIKALSAIAILPSTGPEILLSREAAKPWTCVINGVSQEANEPNLYLLLKTVTTGKALSFESDAATDFTPWGLDRPILRLRFLATDNQTFELRFGMDRNGNCFANRLGTPTVIKIDESLIRSIAVRPYEWRSARLWSIDKVNLLAIKRSGGNSPSLTLKYRFIDEAWAATHDDGHDLSAEIDPVKANYLLSTLEELQVLRWLAVDDESAINALKKPTLEYQIVEKQFDEKGDFSGTVTRRLTLAPMDSSARPTNYFGRLGSESNPFMIDAESYDKLAAGLLAD